MVHQFVEGALTLELDDMGVTGQMQNKGLEVTSEDLF